MNRRPRSTGMCASRARQRLACSTGMAATICSIASPGIARRTRSPTTGCAARTASAATRGPLAVRTSVADSTSSLLTSSGESGSVEAMDSGSRGGQLDRMAALGGQVQISPCDDVLVGVRGKPPQAKSTQHRTETDLDADQFEAVVRAPIRGRHRRPVPSRCPTMSTIWVSRTSRTSRISSFASASTVEVIANVAASSPSFTRTPVCSKRLNCSPRHQQVWTSTARHKDPLDKVRADSVVKASCEIREPAEHLPVGPSDFPAGDLSKGEHSRIMPESSVQEGRRHSSWRRPHGCSGDGERESGAPAGSLCHADLPTVRVRDLPHE